MLISEVDKERLRTKTIEVLLDVRAAYLRSPGANILKHWAIIQNRMRAAARTSTSPEEWATTICKTLQIHATSVEAARSITDLVHEVTERRCKSDWLDLVEREHTYLIAMTRLLAERRAEESSESK